MIRRPVAREADVSAQYRREEPGGDHKVVQPPSDALGAGARSVGMERVPAGFVWVIVTIDVYARILGIGASSKLLSETVPLLNSEPGGSKVSPGVGSALT